MSNEFGVSAWIGLGRSPLDGSIDAGAEKTTSDATRISDTRMTSGPAGTSGATVPISVSAIVMPSGCRLVLHTILDGLPSVVEIFTNIPSTKVVTSIDGGLFLPADWWSKCG